MNQRKKNSEEPKVKFIEKKRKVSLKNQKKRKKMKTKMKI